MTYILTQVVHFVCGTTQKERLENDIWLAAVDIKDSLIIDLSEYAKQSIKMLSVRKLKSKVMELGGMKEPLITVLAEIDFDKYSSDSTSV